MGNRSSHVVPVQLPSMRLCCILVLTRAQSMPTAQGFYGVYGKVFATIRAEDIEYLDHVGEHDYPPFGKVSRHSPPGGCCSHIVSRVHDFYAGKNYEATDAHRVSLESASLDRAQVTMSRPSASSMRSGRATPRQSRSRGRTNTTCAMYVLLY